MSRLLVSQTPGFMRVNRSRARPALCTVQPPKGPWPVLSADPSEALRKVLSSGAGNQFAVGTALGFATGYAVKRVGQVLMVFVGMEVIALQLMASRGWVVVNWSLIGQDLSPHVEKNAIDRTFDAIKLKVPFAGSFTAGCYAGMRWS